MRMEKEVALSEMKQIEVSILKYIKEVCNDNKFNYYLCGGTLLGAVRHKGFIPWDDDIDIFMPREDYMKLLDILRNTPNSLYKMMSFYDNEDYYHTFAKVVLKKTSMIENDLPFIKDLGVYVDIFPIDGLPNAKNKRIRHFKKMLFYRRMLKISIFSKFPNNSTRFKNILRAPFWFLCRLIGFRRLIRLVDKTAMKYKFDNSDFVACSVAGYNFKEILPADVFSETIVVDFEDEKFAAPAGYNIYLSNLYGDYMKLPPEDKRESHHKFKAHWKEEK